MNANFFYINDLKIPVFRINLYDTIIIIYLNEEINNLGFKPDFPAANCYFDYLFSYDYLFVEKNSELKPKHIGKALFNNTLFYTFDLSIEILKFKIIIMTKPEKKIKNSNRPKAIRC